MERWTLVDTTREPGMTDADVVDPTGCHHEDAAAAIESYLGFCGCGMPEEALRYVRDRLRVIGGTWQEIRAPFDSDGEAYFFWYWLDDRKITEHGGSVPGWLTDYGKKVLADLESLDLDDD